MSREQVSSDKKVREKILIGLKSFYKENQASIEKKLLPLPDWITYEMMKHLPESKNNNLSIFDSWIEEIRKDQEKAFTPDNFTSLSNKIESNSNYLAQNDIRDDLLLELVKSDPEKYLKLLNQSQTITCMQFKGSWLKHISDPFKKDIEIVMEAAKNNPNALKLVEDRDIILAAISQNGAWLQYLPDFHDDHEIVKAAYDNYYWILGFLNDRESVASILSQDGLALQYASNRFKADIAVVDVAVENNPNALKFVINDATILHFLKTDGLLRQYTY